MGFARPPARRCPAPPLGEKLLYADCVRTPTSRDRLVPFSSKLAFGVGQFAEGLKNTAFAIFVLFYYNQVLELPGTLAGLALMIALLFDAVTDPLAGSLSDNWKSRLGRRHPFMYASAVPLALAFVGLLWPPGNVETLGEWGLFAWLTVFAILTRGAMTLYHVPHLALGAEMTENYNERNRIVAFRQFFAAIGVAAVSIIGFGYFFTEERGGRTEIANYAPFAIVLGVLMVATIWYSAAGTQKEVRHLSEPAPKPKRNVLAQLGLDLVAGFSNRSFVWLFLGVLVVYVMAGVNSALDLYMYQYFWELASQEMLWLNMGTVLGLLLGVFLVVPLLRSAGKRSGVILGTAVWAVCQVFPVVLRLLGWLPENGEDALFSILFVFKFVQGLILQLAFVAFGSMMADVADEHEYEAGVRQEGIFFGAVAFSAKATSGFGTFLGGLGLDLIEWPRGAEIQTAADVPPETLVHLGLFYGPIVAGFSIVSIWCYTHYGLTRERHARIVEELNERRRQESAGDRPKQAPDPRPAPAPRRAGQRPGGSGVD